MFCMYFLATQGERFLDKVREFKTTTLRSPARCITTGPCQFHWFSNFITINYPFPWKLVYISKWSKSTLTRLLLFFTLIRFVDNLLWFTIEMGPDPTRVCFWLAVNMRLADLWPGYFFTWPYEIFLAQRIKNWKIWNFYGEIFPNPKVAYPTRAQQQKNDQTPVKYFWPEPITNLHWDMKLLFIREFISEKYWSQGG